MIGATDGRGVPQNLEAERSVLGALLLHADAVADVELRPDDFHLPRHQVIYRAIVAAHADRGQTDPLVVGDELSRRGRLADVGGPDYLQDLLDSIVTASGIKSHAEIVREKSIQRRLLDTCNDIARMAGENELDSADLLVELQRRLTDLDATATKEPHRMRAWSDVATDPPVAWLVDGLVPRGGLVVLAGEPSSGKTLLALDQALRCAHGMPWLGRACRPASTIYLAGEGSGGLGARLRAWRAAHPEARAVDGHYVAIVDGVPNLTRPGAARELDNLLAAAQRDHGRAVDVVVIDTLAMAAPGTDENDAGAVGLVLATLADLRRCHGCAVEILHHLRKPQAGAPSRADQHALRGSSAIAGAVDVTLLAGADGDEHALRVAKVRDGEVPALMRYRIVSQDTGMARDDGRPEHGPVILPATAITEPIEANLEQAIVDYVRGIGHVVSANAALKGVTGKRRDLLDAWKVLLLDKRIVNVGTSRAHDYVPADHPAAVGGSAAVCAASPTPPTPGNREPVAVPVPGSRNGVAVPGTSGNQREPGEPMQREYPEEPVADSDDGMPEQPQGRRQFRAVRP